MHVGLATEQSTLSVVKWGATGSNHNDRPSDTRRGAATSTVKFHSGFTDFEDTVASATLR